MDQRKDIVPVIVCKPEQTGWYQFEESQFLTWSKHLPGGVRNAEMNLITLWWPLRRNDVVGLDAKILGPPRGNFPLRLLKIEGVMLLRKLNTKPIQN